MEGLGIKGLCDPVGFGGGRGLPNPSCFSRCVCIEALAKWGTGLVEVRSPQKAAGSGTGGVIF